LWGGLCANYSLGANFNAVGGTEYWLSLVPDLGFPPQWGWSTGTGGDGASYQVFFGTGGPQASDLAFTLSGSPAGVPEPASWAMMLLGFFGLGGALRARRRMTLAAA
jgi:hypothetical protein